MNNNKYYDDPTFTVLFQTVGGGTTWEKGEFIIIKMKETLLERVHEVW